MATLSNTAFGVHSVYHTTEVFFIFLLCLNIALNLVIMARQPSRQKHNYFAAVLRQILCLLCVSLYDIGYKHSSQLENTVKLSFNEQIVKNLLRET